jgi:hypothetical protein
LGSQEAFNSIIGKVLDQNGTCVIGSLDLSAAFDLLDKDLLKKRMSYQGYSHQMVNIIYDWLSFRYGYVEVGRSTSDVFRIGKGCVQGSVTGSLLFAILMSPLSELYRTIIQYADDNYIIFEGQNAEEMKEEIESIMSKIVKWLSRNGMVVNTKKTEFCIFKNGDIPRMTLKVG